MMDFFNYTGKNPQQPTLQKSKVKILKIQYWMVLLLLLITGFYACKRSISHQTNREYDAKLIQVLRKLEHRYADKKVRINTWDEQLDAYQDLNVLDQNEQTIQTLTIGDSVKLIGLDLSQPDGIRVEVISNENKTGYIPYWKVEEFEPAKLIDPDLKP